MRVFLRFSAVLGVVSLLAIGGTLGTANESDEGAKCSSCQEKKDATTETPKKDSSAPADARTALPCSCPNFVIDDLGTSDPADDYWYCDRYVVDCEEYPGADVIVGDYGGMTYTCDNCPASFLNVRVARFPGFTALQPLSHRFRLSPRTAPHSTISSDHRYVRFTAQKRNGTDTTVYAMIYRYSVKESSVAGSPVKDAFLGVEIAQQTGRRPIDMGRGVRRVDQGSTDNCYVFELPGLFPAVVFTKRL